MLGKRQKFQISNKYRVSAARRKCNLETIIIFRFDKISAIEIWNSLTEWNVSVHKRYVDRVFDTVNERLRASIIINIITNIHQPINNSLYQLINAQRTIYNLYKQLCIIYVVLQAIWIGNHSICKALSRYKYNNYIHRAYQNEKDLHGNYVSQTAIIPVITAPRLCTLVNVILCCETIFRSRIYFGSNPSFQMALLSRSTTLAFLGANCRDWLCRSSSEEKRWINEHRKFAYERVN